MAFSSYNISEGEWFDTPADGIHTISVPGGEISQISDLWPCQHPSWSPDGRWMAFVCDPGKFDYGSRQTARAGLYVMESDGSNPTILDDNPSYYQAYWSPRGDIIAVRVFRGEYEAEVLFLDVSGPPFRVNTPVQQKSWGEVKKTVK